MKKLLPIGSVVLLEGANKRLMISGRMQIDVATGISYDYSGCFFPEGMINSKEMYMFNNENIKKIFFVGLQDEEEFMFRKFLEEQINSSEEQVGGVNE